MVDCIFNIFFSALRSGLLLPLVGFGVVASVWRLTYFLLIGGKFNNE